MSKQWWMALGAATLVGLWMAPTGAADVPIKRGSFDQQRGDQEQTETQSYELFALDEEKHEEDHAGELTAVDDEQDDGKKKDGDCKDKNKDGLRLDEEQDDGKKKDGDCKDKDKDGLSVDDRVHNVPPDHEDTA